MSTGFFFLYVLSDYAIEKETKNRTNN